MELWTLIITLISSVNLAYTIKQTMKNNKVIFDGFDCCVPKKLLSFLAKDWCCPAKAIAKHALGERNVAKTVTILQNKDFQIVSGVRCNKEITRFLVYCSSYSHMKLMRLPKILQPEVMSTEEFTHVRTCRAYIYKGQTIKIELNEIVQIPMILHGSVTMDELIYFVKELSL